MIPVTLKLSNFTSFGEATPELDFTKFHMAVISGSNGVGKSSILDAITWCVWGWSRAGDSSDQLVRLGSGEMWVEFTFMLDDHLYTVKRRRSLNRSGTTSLELWSGSHSAEQKSFAHNLTEGTIKTTQQKIINLLHLTMETFANSSFLRQGHADEFTTKGATDRKRILADILGLDHYDLLEEKAKEKTKEIQTKLSLLEYQLIEIEAELSQKEESENKLKIAAEKISQVETVLGGMDKTIKLLRDQREKFTILGQQQKKLEQSYHEQKIELEEIMDQGKKRAERIALLEESLTKLPEIQKNLLSLKNLQEKVALLNIQKQKKLEIEGKIAIHEGNLNLKKQQLEQLINESAKIESQLKGLEKEGAKCPTCGQEIGKEHKTKVKKELEGHLAKILLEMKTINTKPDEEKLNEQRLHLKSFSQLETYDGINTKLKELEHLQEEKEKLLGSSAELETEKKTVSELRSFYKNKLVNVQKLEQEIKDTPNVEENLLKINLQLEDKEKELLILKEEEKEARNTFGQVQALISKADQLEQRQKEKLAEKSELTEEKYVFEELALAFGKKGIQAMIIETAIPEIEDEANSLLNRLTEGRMKIKFETQRETKTKMADGERGIVETLDIIISDEMGERPYEMYSGGEAFRANFAIRLALSKLLTRRAGAKLQFLVIDEGFGTQDAEGRTRIVEVLDTIKNDFEKILIITHLDELKEEFSTRIEVSKGIAGSTFEVVGV